MEWLSYSCGVCWVCGVNQILESWEWNGLSSLVCRSAIEIQFRGHCRYLWMNGCVPSENYTNGMFKELWLLLDNNYSLGITFFSFVFVFRLCNSWKPSNSIQCNTEKECTARKCNRFDLLTLWGLGDFLRPCDWMIVVCGVLDRVWLNWNNSLQERFLTSLSKISWLWSIYISVIRQLFNNFSCYSTELLTS